MSRMFGGNVAFGVSREVAFDYLVDPRNRPLTDAYDDVLQAARQLLV